MARETKNLPYKTCDKLFRFRMYFGDNWQEYKKQSIVLNRHSLPLSLSLHQLYVDIFHAAQSIYQKSSFITRYQNPINIK